MTDQERIFTELVEYSWERYSEAFHNKRLDDVLVGAVIASMVRSGYSLIGLNSDGVNHHLRFEHLPQQTRLIFRLTHLSEDLTVAKVQGHLGQMVVGYGERTGNIQSVWSGFETDAKSLFSETAEPGLITFDADLSSGYMYAQICLILNMDRYIDKQFKVQLELFRSHLDSVVASLQKYLRGRLAVPA